MAVWRWLLSGNILFSITLFAAMARIAFKVKLLTGFEAEYRKRPANIWPELVKLLKGTGIEEYSIFLDESNNDLFGTLKIADPKDLMS